MRQIEGSTVTEAVKKLCIDINRRLPPEMVKAIRTALDTEESPEGKGVLKELLENADIADREGVPYCQDTGVTMVYVQHGEDVRVTGSSLREAINKGVSAGYKEGYLRKSVVADPIGRKNTGDNTPASVHLELVPGDRLRLAVMAKGTGSENMSRMKVLVPADGVEGIKAFVYGVVREAGSNACPPVTLGVGIGGTFDTVGWLAKKALFRPYGSRHPDKPYADLEGELLKGVNDLGIGPMGYGGRVTALDVRVEHAPCHIGALPAAVNLQCHAHRIGEVIL